MPAEHIIVSFKPVGFFKMNPSLDVPSEHDLKSVPAFANAGHGTNGAHGHGEVVPTNGHNGVHGTVDHNSENDVPEPTDATNIAGDDDGNGADGTNESSDDEVVSSCACSE